MMKERNSEILRYLGYRGQPLSAELPALIDKAWAEVVQAARPRWVFSVFPLVPDGAGLRVGDTALVLTGQDIARHLRNCDAAALFACTLGIEIDRYIIAKEHEDLVFATLLDACATQLTEETTEAACREIKESLSKGQACRRGRFSPGYGDLSLDIHTVFLRLLNTQRRIGLSETAHHTLLPRKSVTGIAGIYNT